MDGALAPQTLHELRVLTGPPSKPTRWALYTPLHRREPGPRRSKKLPKVTVPDLA